jgi:hypothetical protein
MKKFLLVLTLFASFSALQKANAQCSVGNETVIIKGTNNSATNCVVTFDLVFDLQNNSGNKYVFIHAWKDADYPSYFQQSGQCNTPANPNPNQSTFGPPVRGTNAQGNLDASLINVGFNNDVGTAGYLSYITSANYLPDPGTPMTVGTGLVEVSTSPLAGFTRFTMRNLQIATGQGCNAPLTVRADLWSSQAKQLSVAHCWRCDFTFSFNDPIISGFVNCTSPARTFNLTLQTTSSSALGGTYDAYYDNAPFNSFGPEDLVGGPIRSGTFSGLTSSSPVAKINEPYTGNTDPVKSTLSLWVDVKVTSGSVQSNTIAKLLPNNCFTLPVNLKNFDAAKRTGKVAVTWQTEQEVNNDGFEIQRRVGNGKYETIAFVDSKAPGGNSNGAVLSYSYDDNTNLPNGVAYYRLRQVDLDGKSIYSEIKAVRSNSKSLYITVYPNPSRGTTNVAIPEGVGTVDVALEDFSGKLVQRWNALNVRNLQLTNLKAGIYMIRINARETGEQVVERIVVQ